MTSQLDSSYLISPPIYARATGSDDYISALAKGTYFGDMQMSGWSDLSRQPGQPEPKNTQIPTPPGTYEFSKPIEIPPSKAPSHSPVYDLYGSSVVAVNPLLTTSKFPAPLPSSTPAFDPVALGLPVPPPKVAGSKNVTGLYSSSGFDMMGVLARVASRVNPQIQIGPVDLSCSFLVVDAKKFDMPIVYASETFSKLTGYPNEEIGTFSPLIRKHLTDSCRSWSKLSLLAVSYWRRRARGTTSLHRLRSRSSYEDSHSTRSRKSIFAHQLSQGW